MSFFPCKKIINYHIYVKWVKKLIEILLQFAALIKRRKK
jgi:hypothetical protein